MKLLWLGASFVYCPLENIQAERGLLDKVNIVAVEKLYTRTERKRFEFV